METRAPLRRTTLAGLALALVAAAMLLTWPAAGVPETRVSAEPLVVELYPDLVLVNVRDTFDRDVVVSSPVLRIGEAQGPAELHPIDGEDHEGDDLDPLALEAGTPVAISGWLQPPCAGDRDVSLSVTVTDASGARVLHRYDGSNVAELDAAVAEFCDRGPTVRARAYHWEPDGDARASVTVMNPGPDAITVELPAYADEFVTWSSLEATVPADETTTYEIRGTDVDCEPGETASWLGGRLLVDGEPFVIRAERGSWC